MKKVLITGISGFAGSFLAEYLLQQGYSVSGTVLRGTTSPNISHIQDKLQLFSVNLLEKEAVDGIIEKTKPDEIYHLAALTSPAKSFENPQETIMNNIVAEMNIFEGVKKAKLTATKILITSSAEVYGLVSKENLPIDENTPLRPSSPYAVSKITQDFLALQYFLSEKMQIIRVRPFNHIGPRQSPMFVVARFASQIAQIEKGAEPVLKVGNLSAKRDFTDVRDIVKGYHALMQKGTVGDVYNIGSGTSYKIEDILNKLLGECKVKVSVEVDKSMFRSVDIPDLVCNIGKITSVTGWKPTISLDQTLKDTLDYWRGIS